MALGRTDERMNFKQLPSRITLRSAVDDRMYVPDHERTYFMGGKDSGEAVLVEKANYPAIPFTAQKIDAARVGDLSLSGTTVLWLSKMGVCMGGGEGAVQEPDRGLLPDRGRIHWRNSHDPKASRVSPILCMCRPYRGNL